MLIMRIRGALLCWIPLFFLSLSTSWSQAQSDSSKSETNPVPVQSLVLLAPANTSISFVGIHVGDDPKPRLGGFQRFSGHVVVDPASGSVQSVVVDIDVESLWTQFEKLSGHLKNEDFFETDKFPTAKFVSTKIETGKSGQGLMTGELTLHGETQQVQFPIKVQMKDGGLVLQSKFKLDRSKFGMDQMLSGVDKMVDIEVVVGRATSTTTEKPGHGGESKKKQTRQRLPENLQLVSLYLPNMT